MGLWSKAWKRVKKAAKAVVRAISNVVRAVVSIVRRIVKAFDWVGSLLGIRPRKRLMLHVLILRDKAKPVIPPLEVERWVQVTKDVLKDRCNIELIQPRLSDRAAKEAIDAGLPTTFPLVEVAAEDAPEKALTVPAKASSAWNGELDYFHERSALDYAKPTVSGFVIRDVSNDARGFAWGMITDVFVVDPEALSTSLAHETGHLCWLLHRGKAHNLMTPRRDDMDSQLTRWQISAIRSSEYAHY